MAAFRAVRRRRRDHDATPAASAAPLSGQRLPGQNRWAGAGIVLILVAVSLFAVWSTHRTAAAARTAASAGRVSDDSHAAAAAVVAEESLEREYRLQPGPDVRARFNVETANLMAALNRMRDDDVGDGSVPIVDRAFDLHTDYLAAVDQLFLAVDRGDLAAQRRIDELRVNPVYETMAGLVSAQSARKRADALAALAELERLEQMTSLLTPVIFALGLVLAALLGMVNRGYRRMLEAERARAVHDALHDSLTGLPNRVLLSDRFEQALHAAGRSGAATALLLIDLDRFKEINDTFGHRYGDQMLAQVGPRLGTVLRNTDTVARLGGDEFAVLLSAIPDLSGALAVAEKLTHSLEAPFFIDGVEINVEASIGVAVSGLHGNDVATLLQRADIAMYVAKEQNLGVAVYSRDTDSNSPGRLALLGELRRALDRHEIELHYQPQVDVGSGEVVGVEALARWLHPTRGLVMPDDFIPTAEHTGLVGPFTRYVLDVALAQARRWLDAGHPMVVSVNLSARNLLDEQLPAQVLELLAVHEVPAGLLELEVTESAIMVDPQRARQLLQNLAAHGVRLAIDDFGAGYTSLGQLRALPVNRLKIDRSFVQTMTEERSNALIVRSVVHLGHNLGMQIVAEGVEDPATLAELGTLGCDIAQGYQVLHPVPVADLDAWCLGQRLATPADTST